VRQNFPGFNHYFKFAFIFYPYELEYNNSGLKLDQTYTLGISCLSDF